ncbi:hypothetical protein [Streptomyces griseus]|uniref:hypothetical protein n=1 Tax=Streptomyces griseus TaxID=1911 RepID=UPI00084010F4|nr:hypothetical protein [Streptomyces griseus]
MIEDDDAWMARIIREYDKTEDPDLRTELLACHGIHPQVLASARRRLARRPQTPATKQAVAPSVPLVTRTVRAKRRPTTPRRAGAPRTYRVTHTRRVRTPGQTVTVTTTTVTVTTVTTVTRTSI